MALTRSTSAQSKDVWKVLSNAWYYSSWVVGGARIRAVDDNWPEPGAKFYHSAGFWPLLLDDYTEVLASEPTRYLKLSVRAWPFGRAAVELTLHDKPDGCDIEMAEYGTTAPMKWVPERTQEFLIRPRNAEALRRLALIAEGGGS
jgi:hypothetical protein